MHRRIGELDRDRRHLVVCRSGNRSGAVTDVLAAHRSSTRSMSRWGPQA